MSFIFFFKSHETYQKILLHPSHFIGKKSENVSTKRSLLITAEIQIFTENDPVTKKNYKCI